MGGLMQEGIILASFWTSPELSRLSDSVRLLAAYLLSCQHRSRFGLYSLPIAYVAADLRWDERKALEAFDLLGKKGFVHYDHVNGWVFLPRYLEHNPFPKGSERDMERFVRRINMGSPLLATLRDAWRSHADVPQSIKDYLDSIDAQYTGTTLDLFGGSIEPAPQASASASRESATPPATAPAKKTTPKKVDETVDYPDAFEKAWRALPSRNGSNNKRKAFFAWQARLRAGHKPDLILQGVLRYATYIRATNKEHTPYVLQGATFFGPDLHFLEPWEVSAARGTTVQGANNKSGGTRVSRENPMLKLLRGEKGAG